MTPRAERSHAPSPNPNRNLGSRAEQIQDAALALFAESGNRAATIGAIGGRAGIRGPSLYKHVQSKQELLRLSMIQTMQQLLELQRSALAGTDEPSVQLRRVVEAHGRYHATHRHEAFVGTREIDSLEEPSRTEVISLRGRYERTCAG